LPQLSASQATVFVQLLLLLLHLARPTTVFSFQFAARAQEMAEALLAARVAERDGCRAA